MAFSARTAGIGEFENITDSLKKFYTTKKFAPMLNQETPFRNRLKKGIPPGGTVKEGIVTYPMTTKTPQAVGQHVDGDTLPAAKDRTDLQGTLKPTIFSAAMQIGWLTRSAGNSNASAFKGGELRRRTEETVADLGRFIESTYTGTHGTGRRGRVLSDGSNTLVMDKPEGVLLFDENQYITVRTTDGGNTAADSDALDYRKITAIDRDTNTITYDGADQTASAGDHVHVVASAGQTALTTLSANGLRGLIDDGTYASSIGGLSRTTHPKLKANVAGNGGSRRDLSEQILVNACHKNRERSGKRVQEGWWNYGQIEKYIQFVAPDRRYQQSGNGITTMATGYTEESIVHYAPGVAVKFNLSFTIIPREIYLINWETFFHYVARELGWWDAPSMLMPMVNGDGQFKAAFYAAVSAYENIGCDFPIGNTVIRDLNDPICGD